jgi:perosamine synthetase
VIRLCEPEIDNAEIDAVSSVLRSGFLVQGRFVGEFEEKIRKYLGARHAIAVSSGTAALHLVVAALGIGQGDEVIVPDFTFPAAANVVELAGAKPVFVDVELDTLNIDVSKIEAKINKYTKAIIPVHEFGLAANMDDILKISNKYGLKVIEDAACALGTTYNNEYVGTIGDAGCFSLHPRKAITTGEGGIIVTNSDETATQLRVLRNHGISAVDGFVDFIRPGFNYRMTDMQGAIGSLQIEKLDSIIRHRKQLADIYFEGLGANKNILLPSNCRNNEHTYQTFHVILNKSLNRNSIINELKKYGIECNYGAYSLHSLSYYKNKYAFNPSEYVNSAAAYEQGAALPLHSRMSNADVEYIVDKINLLTK